MGHGKKSIIAFHGFGQDAHAWDELAAALGNDFRIIAIQAPWHGDQIAANFSTQKPIEPSELADAVHHILCAEQAADSVFISYSLGARIALNYLAHYPNSASKIIFLAPDGLKPLFWRNLATQSTIGRMLFKYTMRHPGWLLGPVSAAVWCRLITNSTKKFIHLQIRPLNNRRKLYATWTALRKVHPKIIPVIEKELSNQVPVYLIMGSRDTIIPPKNARKLLKACPQTSYIEISSGHFLLNKDGVDKLCEIIRT